MNGGSALFSSEGREDPWKSGGRLPVLVKIALGFLFFWVFLLLGSPFLKN